MEVLPPFIEEGIKKCLKNFQGSQTCIVQTQNMYTYLTTLQEISIRYAPSRILSFDRAHVFKALQLIETRGHTSRDVLCKELNLGEDSIKTLVKQLLFCIILDKILLMQNGGKTQCIIILL